MVETCQQFNATLTPGGDLEINVKGGWRNPPKNYFMKQQPFGKTNVENSWGNPPQNLF